MLFLSDKLGIIPPKNSFIIRVQQISQRGTTSINAIIPGVHSGFLLFLGDKFGIIQPKNSFVICVQQISQGEQPL